MVARAHASRLAASAALALTASLALLGCKTGGAAQKIVESSSPNVESATGQSQCGVVASPSKPLVVEWPAAERGALEARAMGGLVAVHYSGCEMEVLTNCRAKGSYQYIGITPKRETVRIQNADELYANLPVGAIKLEGKLERAGELNVDMTVIGRKEANEHTFVAGRNFEGRCEDATHVITGLTVGAFNFYAGAAADIGAGVEAQGVAGVGGSSSASREVLNQDGDSAACGAAQMGASEPPPGCGALLRVEVVPIETPAGTPIASTPTGSDAEGPALPADPEIDKKIKRHQTLYLVGYLGALLGGGLAVYGWALSANYSSDATADDVGAAGSSEREQFISRYSASQGLLWGGIAGAVAFLGVAIYGNLKAKKLKEQKARMAFEGGAMRWSF